MTTAATPTELAAGTQLALQLSRDSRRGKPHAVRGVAARTTPLGPVLRSQSLALACNPATTEWNAAAAAASSAASSSSAAATATAAPSGSLVHLPAQPELGLAGCTRKLCCASFPLPSAAAPASSSSSTSAASSSSAAATPVVSSSSASASAVRVFWGRHQPENEHFESDHSDKERAMLQQLKDADAELRELTRRKHHVDHHITVLHRYNEIKDVVQALMGKCAELEGKTTKDMYEKFGLELED